MRRGQKPKPTAIRRANGNPGKRAWNHAEPTPPDAQPRCPGHLSSTAQKEWRRLACSLHRMGVLTTIDRAALAAYCQSYGRWVEAEERLKETPALYKTPSGYVQQSPWLGIANKQLELMGRFMVELGMTPAARTRVAVAEAPGSNIPKKLTVEFVTIYEKEPDPDTTLLIGWKPNDSEGVER
ncbi:MAG: phage terminase small subunit P27 family [Rhodobacteraceae bacterium]|nr:phage terminase small subunit P27 family [Paracoccaceae bacterium]